MSAAALTYLARGIGLTGPCIEKSGNEDTYTITLLAPEESTSTHSSFDEAMKFLISNATEAPPAANEVGAAFLEKTRALNYTFDAANEEAVKVVQELNTHFSADSQLFSGEDKPSVADLLIYAAVQDFITTSTPPQKGAVRFLMGYARRVGKFAQAPKPTTPNKQEQKEDQRPLDDVTRFKLVVGKVTKVWHHPEADGLYCEEIDIGEEKPRQIATGIRKYFPQEEFENSMVIVLANMKPRALRGFTSEGMVMCASNPEHTVVKPVRPPSTAKPGDRVTFENYEGAEPDDVLRTKKGQESIPAILPHLKTNGETMPLYKDHKWLVNGEPLSCPGMPNCTIS